jgi:uncharacterized protein (TIGR02444 family)
MDNPLWQYSLHHYDLPEVAPLCLAAQDRYAVEVNFLLYGAWLASRGQPLDSAHLAALAEATREWRERVVHPLRRLRRDWRDVAGAAPLRRQVQALELDAERALQDAIWAFYQGQPPAAGAARIGDNLAVVLAMAGVPPSGVAGLLPPLVRALGD